MRFTFTKSCIYALRYSFVIENSRCPSASAAVSRPLAVRTIMSIKASPAWSMVISPCRIFETSRSICSFMVATVFWIARQFDHGLNRVANHISLPRGEEMNDCSGSGPKSDRLRGGAGCIHKPQAGAAGRNGRFQAAYKLGPLAKFLHVAQRLLLNRRQAARDVALRRLRFGKIICLLTEDQVSVVLKCSEKLLAHSLVRGPWRQRCAPRL